MCGRDVARYRHGEAAGREDGAQRVIDIPTADIERTMRLLCVFAIEELHPGFVRLP